MNLYKYNNIYFPDEDTYNCNIFPVEWIEIFVEEGRTLESEDIGVQIPKIQPYTPICTKNELRKMLECNVKSNKYSNVKGKTQSRAFTGPTGPFTNYDGFNEDNKADFNYDKDGNFATQNGQTQKRPQTTHPEANKNKQNFRMHSAKQDTKNALKRPYSTNLYVGGKKLAEDIKDDMIDLFTLNKDHNEHMEKYSKTMKKNRSKSPTNDNRINEYDEIEDKQDEEILYGVDNSSMEKDIGHQEHTDFLNELKKSCNK